jgi:phosphatidylethanolamine-binding protein
MKFLAIILVVLTISFTNGEDSVGKTVKQSFEDEEIVPDVLKSVDDIQKLKISYLSGVKVDMGNILTPTQVKNQPIVEWEAEEGALYTLLMTGEMNMII